MADQEALQAFTCRRCGDCCRGRGGIMVTPGDVKRLCAHLEISPETFERRFLERVNGKARIRTVNDWCVFFDAGCLVHPAKPSVCRVWPFFQGNMLDELSWQMAQDACPGINPRAGHAAFVREGLHYLNELNLEPEDNGPNALNMTHLLHTNRQVD